MIGKRHSISKLTAETERFGHMPGHLECNFSRTEWSGQVAITVLSKGIETVLPSRRSDVIVMTTRCIFRWANPGSVGALGE